MLSDTLQGVRERRGRRWFLVTPAALFVGIGVLCGTIPPAFSTMCGVVLAFFPCYAMVVTAGIVAPTHKKITAALFVVLGIVICYPSTPPDADPDALPPHAVWAGAIIGCFLALIMVARRVRPRWLLVIPAYLVGFDLLFLPAGLTAGFLVPNEQYSALTFMLISCSGGIAFASWMAPAYKLRTMMAACLPSLTFIVLTLCQF